MASVEFDTVTPRRPPTNKTGSSFAHYVAQEYHAAKASRPVTETNQSIMRHLAQRWESLNEDEKAPFKFDGVTSVASPEHGSEQGQPLTERFEIVLPFFCPLNSPKYEEGPHSS